jgi:two-component system sensor histidine kinase PilS (NtrC family)
VEDIFHPGLLDFSQKILTALQTGRAEIRAEINIRHPKKGIIPIGISSSVLPDELGHTRGVIAIFQDLTEAKKLEARLRASDRLAAVGRLAAGIAHEIRNPLASISGSVEVLKDDLCLTDGDDLRLLELILKESSRLNTILTDFLNFARVSRSSSGKSNLSSAILEVVSLYTTHQQSGKAIRITHDIHLPNIMVMGSEDQIKQILWNLILNASQALEEDGDEIHISTGSMQANDGSQMVRLEVADNGPGILPDIREKIFDPFFSTKDDGTGLGLPIVARIVDCLGGRIELDSSPEWKTVFVVYLPIAGINDLVPEAPHQTAPIAIS